MNSTSLQLPDFFKDPWNPTKEEIEKWAYGNYFTPDQDWELAVMDDPFLILKLALDQNCPNRKFFLRALAIFIEDEIKKQ
jgi:hypothetical protein